MVERKAVHTREFKNHVWNSYLELLRILYACKWLIQSVGQIFEKSEVFLGKNQISFSISIDIKMKISVSISNIVDFQYLRNTSDRTQNIPTILKMDDIGIDNNIWLFIAPKIPPISHKSSITVPKVLICTLHCFCSTTFWDY